MLSQVTDKVFDPDTDALKVFFDTKLEVIGDIHSYGHDIEATWLMDLACETIGDIKLMEEFKNMNLRISENIYNLAFEDGALNTERDKDYIEKKRVWWVQAESVVGFINAYQKSGNKKYLDAAKEIWEYIKTGIIDKREGSEWFNEVGFDGKPFEHKEMVGPWKCPYHNGRMCLEVISRGIE